MRVRHGCGRMAAKKATTKKATMKKAAATKPAAKKPAAKKAPAKNPAAKKAAPKKAAPKPAAPAPTSGGMSPSKLIDGRIKELGDWRGERLAQIRQLIKDAIPGVIEEWKWRGVPVWYHEGMLCTGETYKDAVKVTFAKGALLKDPARLFNSSLEGNIRRAIDFHEGDSVNAAAFKDLMRAAAALNES